MDKSVRDGGILFNKFDEILSVPKFLRLPMFSGIYDILLLGAIKYLKFFMLTI